MGTQRITPTWSTVVVWQPRIPRFRDIRSVCVCKATATLFNGTHNTDTPCTRHANGTQHTATPRFHRASEVAMKENGFVCKHAFVNCVGRRVVYATTGTGRAASNSCPSTQVPCGLPTPRYQFRVVSQTIVNAPRQCAWSAVVVARLITPLSGILEVCVCKTINTDTPCIWHTKERSTPPRPGSTERVR